MFRDWAYQAVKKLVENGYLELYEDGTFRGNNPVDRHTFALVVAKLLTNFGEGAVRAGQDDVALLRKLSNEFQNELVLLTLKNKELEARLVQIEQGRLILAEDQTKNTAGMQALNAELNALRNQVAQLLEEKNRLEARAGHLGNQTGRTTSCHGESPNGVGEGAENKPDLTDCPWDHWGGRYFPPGAIAKKEWADRLFL